MNVTTDCLGEFMTPSFEMVYQIDPKRERDISRERSCTELSDREYLDRLIPSELVNIEQALSREVQKQAEEIHIGRTDEKDEGKEVKRKAKKNPTKRHKATVESVQKEL